MIFIGRKEIRRRGGHINVGGGSNYDEHILLLNKFTNGRSVLVFVFQMVNRFLSNSLLC